MRAGGVPDSEHAEPQRLTLTITVWPKQRFEDLRDDIALSVDYFAVCAAVREMVQKKSNKLIETLTTQLATHLLKAFPIEVVQIEVRKFVVADAKHVSVRVTRSAAVKATVWEEDYSRSPFSPRIRAHVLKERWNLHSARNRLNESRPWFSFLV